MQYALLTRYVIRRRQVTVAAPPCLTSSLLQGLGLRVRNIDGRAVVGGFTEEYLTNHAPCQATDIHVGDIIMAVDSVDTSNPIFCPFKKVVKCLQAAANAHEKHRSYQQVHLGDDLLQFTHRLTAAAKFQDTITLRIARLVVSVAPTATVAPRIPVAVESTVEGIPGGVPEEC
jgi:hypothetical protein